MFGLSRKLVSLCLVVFGLFLLPGVAAANCNLEHDDFSTCVSGSTLALPSFNVGGSGFTGGGGAGGAGASRLAAPAKGKAAPAKGKAKPKPKTTVAAPKPLVLKTSANTRKKVKDLLSQIPGLTVDETLSPTGSYSYLTLKIMITPSESKLIKSTGDAGKYLIDLIDSFYDHEEQSAVIYNFLNPESFIYNKDKNTLRIAINFI